MMSLTLASKELEHVPDEFVGAELKRILAWQQTKTQRTTYRLGWYLRLIMRMWQVEGSKQRLLDECHKERGKLKSFADILDDTLPRPNP